MSSAVDLHSFLEELQTRRRRILRRVGPSTDATLLAECQEHQVPLDVAVEPTSAPTGEVVLRWELIPVSKQADPGRRSTPLAADAAQLVTFFSAFCVALDTCRSREGMYPVIVAAASRLMPNGGHVGLTVVGARRAVAPVAWSSDVARRLDSFQLEQEKGPLADAMAGLAASSVQTFSPDGLASVAALAVPLVARGRPVGFLTFYAEANEGISQDRVTALGTLAGYASRALAHADQVANLRIAMLSRQDIAEAVGIIMERDRLTPEAAFSQLRQRSQELNITLRQIARAVVETGQSPSAIAGP